VTDKQGQFVLYASNWRQWSDFKKTAQSKLHIAMASQTPPAVHVCSLAVSPKPSTVTFRARPVKLSLTGDIGPLFGHTNKKTLKVSLEHNAKSNWYPAVFKKINKTRAEASFPSFFDDSLILHLPNSLGGARRATSSSFTDPRSFSFEAKHDSVTGTPKGKRTVTFTLKTPKGQPKATGSFTIYVASLPLGRGPRRNKINITKGKGQMIFNAPCQISLGLYSDSWNTPGYIPMQIHCEKKNIKNLMAKDAARLIKIAADSEPLAVTIDLEPAGMIYGTLKNHDGTPAVGRVGSQGCRTSDEGNRFFMRLKVNKKAGTFIATNVPL
jgi:hypothetical protein